MKGISGALLASLFVLFSLISLLLANPDPDGASLLVNAQGAVSELELRYALKR